MGTEQRKVIVDEDFVKEAIVEKLERIGLWSPVQDAYCDIICRNTTEQLDEDRLPTGDFAVSLCVEVTPVFSEEDIFQCETAK